MNTQDRIRSRLTIAAKAYRESWDRSRMMMRAPKIYYGPPQAVGSFRVYSAFPAYTREQIAAECRRGNRMLRVMDRLRAQLRAA